MAAHLRAQVVSAISTGPRERAAPPDPSEGRILREPSPQNPRRGCAPPRETRSRTPRVGLIGARRRHRGLGRFVARDLQSAGAEVPCFLATTPETRDEAARGLAEDGGNARGYVDLDAMLEREELDALAICAPAEAHERYLEAALSAGLHVLCEKPFVWGHSGPASTAARLAETFGAKDLLLMENCPWPYTLATFARLHPGAFDAPPRNLEMSLQPAAHGLGMLADSLPHLLSVLQAAVPGTPAAVLEPSFARESGSRERVRLEFLYRSPSAATLATLCLARSDARLREVALRVDGQDAFRRVDPETYQLSFLDGSRALPLPDPMTALVTNFVAELRSPSEGRAATHRRAIVERMRLLEELTAAGTRSGILP